MLKNDNGSSLLQLLDREKFRELAALWEMDKGIRSFSSWEMTCALITSIGLNLGSFREIEESLGIAKSTFSDALRKRSNGFFSDLCSEVLRQLQVTEHTCKARRALREVLAIDASECSVHGSLFKTKRWSRAALQGNKASCKLHVVFNVDQSWIDSFQISGSKRGDSPMSHYLRLLPNKIYVFDRAYNDMNFWLKIRSYGSHFVTRLKESPKSRELLKGVLKDVDSKDGVLYDGEYRPAACAYFRYAIKEQKFRHVIYRDPISKRILQFISSDMAMEAEEVAQIYKRRWGVELLFRWLKGHANIRYLPAKSTNAVKTQLSCAILLRLLLELRRRISEGKSTAWEILRSIRANYLRRSMSSIESPDGCRWKSALAARLPLSQLRI